MTSVTIMTGIRERRHSGIEGFGALEVRISRTNAGHADRAFPALADATRRGIVERGSGARRHNQAPPERE